MILDKRLEFSDAQALTATAVSTNVIDLTSDRDIGVGETIWTLIQLDVAADDTDADETYVVTLETDDNAAFTSATVIDTITITRGDVAGTRYYSSVPLANERFLRLNYTLGGTTPAVTASAWLSNQEPKKWVSQPDAL